MDNETSLLLELMLHAEMFCNQLETAGKQKLPISDTYGLSLKISQCRGALRELQQSYDEDTFDISSTAVCANFRNLMISLLWANYLGRDLVDRRLFRKLVQIESGFTYLLITRRQARSTPE